MTFVYVIYDICKIIGIKIIHLFQDMLPMTDPRLPRAHGKAMKSVVVGHDIGRTCKGMFVGVLSLGPSQCLNFFTFSHEWPFWEFCRRPFVATPRQQGDQGIALQMDPLKANIPGLSGLTRACTQL